MGGPIYFYRPVIVLLLAWLATITAHAQSPITCEATADRHAFLIPAAGESGLLATDGVEVGGDSEFVATMPNGWRFMLVNTEFGWAIRVYDQPFPNGRVDLSAVTPPFHMPVNPRNIAGWHFRNKANTGPNQGDVNAPQQLRLFQFDGALAATGGLRGTPEARVTDAKSGRGLLNIVDFKLTGPVPKAKARMTYLKFQVCLTWPRLSEADEVARAIEHERRARELDAQMLEYTDVEQELFGSCGLDLTRYQLDARVAPRTLSLDIDHDGAHDQVAQVARLQDNRRGLALCRAGTWLQLLGFDESFDGPTQHLLGAMEAWQVVPSDHGRFGFVDEAAWPDATGEVLAVERIEKGMAIFFWLDGAVQTQKVYGLEPL